MTNEIEKRAAPAPAPLFVSVEMRQDAIEKACTNSVQYTALFASLQKACTDNPKILQCSPASVMDCMLACAMVGINPSGQHNSAWFIPYGSTCKLMIGFNGYIDLITRSSDWHSITAECVYAGEKFEAWGGTRNEIIHQIDIHKRGRITDIVGTYAIARGPNGAMQSVVLDKTDIQKAYQSSKNKAMWDGLNRPEMVKKTAIRKLAKYMVLDRAGQFGVALMDDTQGYEHRQVVSGDNQDLENDLKGLVGDVDPATNEPIPDTFEGGDAFAASMQVDNEAEGRR